MEKKTVSFMRGLLFLTLSQLYPCYAKSHDIYPLFKRNSTLTDSQNTCSLYLAPSSIPHSGFGVYTTQDIAKGEYINRFLDSPSIVIIDKGKTFRTHRNFVWGGDLFTEYEATHVSVSVPNWSSLCNYHTVWVCITFPSFY